MRTVWGFGSFRIGTDSSNYAEFTTRMGRIRFVEEFNEYTTLSGSFRRISKGWRPEIDVKIYNLLTDDWQDVVEMFDHINQTKPLNLRFGCSLATTQTAMRMCLLMTASSYLMSVCRT